MEDKEKTIEKDVVKEVPKDEAPKNSAEDKKVSTEDKPKEKSPEPRPRLERNRRPSRGPRRREARVKPEFEQKIIALRRVTRVMAGGRRFSFAVTLVAGNKKGSVGVGQGKASDTPLAIEKAFRDAKKNMIVVNTTKTMSIPHEVEAKFGASQVKIMPAFGKGILAGSSARTVIEFAGLQGVGAKFISRSKNSTNNAYATIKALKKLKKAKDKTNAVS